MSDELPDGWTWARLEDLKSEEPNAFTDGPFGSKLKTEHYVPEGVRVVRLGNIGVGKFIDKVRAYITAEHFEELRKHQIFPEDLLISALAEPVGRTCEVPPDLGTAIVKADCIRFKVSDTVDRRIIMHWMNSTRGRQSVEELSHGLGRLRINMQDMRSVPVPVPPAPEQRRIVSKIDSLFTRSSRARDELAHIPKLIERYRQAVLEAAFRGDLTADWRAANPGRDASTLIREIAEKRGNLTNGFDSTGLPIGWHWVTLSEIADVGTGATPKRGNAKYYEGGNVPWVTSAATNDAFVDYAEQFITEAAIQETNCKVFPAGSLLLAMYGEGKTRGQVSELRISAATNQACAAIMFSGAAMPLKAHVKSWLMKLYADLREQAAGGVQPNLNLSIIRAIRVPIPPLEEQHELAARITANLSAIEAVHRQVITAHGMLDRLDQSILDKAFTGKLVPQDPADEPASKLLERIQAARAAAPKAKRGRRKAAP